MLSLHPSVRTIFDPILSISGPLLCLFLPLANRYTTATFPGDKKTKPMRIEKIELTGFKSFAEKTVIELHPGITCIVGPNGCGKSNVVDSFKWVLGEQSAKSLRGDKMMEVVFDGSQSKKPKGMAEVSLQVNGINGGSPTTVTRRLYRSGESDYLINRASCRLKDVKDIFLDTGLELKSYAIFEQGNISRIINSKPEDRRFLIEEVAGVVKYKIRRGEAEGKLETSRQNLQRIADIIGEVKRQINSLDRQAKKAERYKRLAEELKGIELRQARKDYLGLSAALEELTASLAALREKDAALRARLSELEDTHAQRRIALADKEKTAGSLNDALQALQREIAAKEREAAVLDTEKEALRQNLERLEKTEVELNRKILDSGQKISGLNAESGALSTTISSFEDTLKQNSSGLDISRETIDQIESELEQERRELFRASEALSSHAGEIGKAELAASAHKRRELSIAGEEEALKETLAQTGKSLTGLEARAVECGRGNMLAREEKEALIEELSALRQRSQDLQAQISGKREDLARVLSRIDSLKEILLDPASREFLNTAVSDRVNIEKSLSDVIEAVPEYERAVEAALKELLAGGFIVPDRKSAIAALKTLRDKDIERTSFIPIAINGNGGEDRPLPTGVLGRATDFVKAMPGYEALTKTLLNDVLIVRELEDAPEATGGFMYISLSGEALEPRGTLAGGKTRGLLARKRELRGLQNEAGSLRAAVSALEEDASETSALTEEKERLLAGAQARLHEFEKEISLLNHSLESGRLELERLQKKSSYLRIEGETLKNELKGMENALEELAGKKTVLEQKKTLKEQEISALQEKLGAARQSYEEERAGLVEQKMELNNLRQALENLKKEISSLEAQGREAGQNLEKAAAEKLAAAQILEQKTAHSEELSSALREVVKKAQEKEAEALEERRGLEELAAEINGYELPLKSLRQEIDALGRQIADAEVKSSQTGMRLENLKENIRNTYQVEIETHEAGPVEEGDEEKYGELKKKLAELGPVSLATIEEYEELTKRFEFLNTQKDDLEKSIAELEEAIKKLNSSTRRMLREAFDALKVKFSEIFVDFFGGGRAELVLTDENNILETGIDIIAQPPGKKLQNINLLSGGEKSLTALSLLFASFLVKPTPLCILDEADAALDESNTFKFAQMVKTLSVATQFIVITHNRVTMEAADYLYGITMQEPGVSRAISMRLSEA